MSPSGRGGGLGACGGPRRGGWEEATLSRHESSTDIATAATREARQELGKNSDFLAGNQVQKRRGCFSSWSLAASMHLRQVGY